MIVSVVSLVVGLLDRSKYQVIFGLLAISPFSFFIAASSFNTVGFLFLFSYVLLSVLMSTINLEAAFDNMISAPMLDTVRDITLLNMTPRILDSNPAAV